jgi:hypothetical protein
MYKASMILAQARAIPLIAILLSLALCSCGNEHAMYLSTAPPVPLLSRPGELKLSATMNSASEGLDMKPFYASVEGAYALKNSIGLIGRVSYSPLSPDSSNTGFFYAECGAGTYLPPSDRGRFEVYGGLGVGRIQSRSLLSFYYYHKLGNVFDSLFGYGPDGGELIERTAFFFRPFLQAAAGHEGEVGAFGVAVRLSYLAIATLTTESTTWHYEWRDSTSREIVRSSPKTSSTTESQSGFFIEPSILWRLGYKSIKTQLQVWFANALNWISDDFWAEFYVSVGVSFDLDL